MSPKPGTAIERIQSYGRDLSAGIHSEDSMLARLISFVVATLSAAWMIRDVNANVVPLKLNGAQLEVMACMLDQAADNLPIRLIIGKDRKRGISTEVQTLFDHLCAHHRNQFANTVAHETTATDGIFEIARLAAKNFPIACTVNKRDIEWSNNSRYHCQTAGGTAVGAGGTPNLMHLSEIPKWDQNKEETHFNCINAVPNTPTSIIVKEATYQGRELFWDQYEAALDPSNPYIPIFFPWFFPPCPKTPMSVGFTPTAEEKDVIGFAHSQGVELSYDNLQWRRNKVIEIGRERFRQEYPATPEEAVQASEGLILPGMRACIVDELPYNFISLPQQCLIGGIDHGYHDPTVIWQALNVDNCVWLVGYYRQSEGLAHEHAEFLLDGTTYFCDPSGVSDRKQLQDASWKIGKRCKFVPAPRRKHPGEDFNTVELRDIVRLAEQGRLKILRSVSKQLIIECDSYVWNSATGKPDETRSVQCGHFDSIHALKYLCMGVINGVDEEVPIVKREEPRMAIQFKRF